MLTVKIRVGINILLISLCSFLHAAGFPAITQGFQDYDVKFFLTSRPLYLSLNDCGNAGHRGSLLAHFFPFFTRPATDIDPAQGLIPNRPEDKHARAYPDELFFPRALNVSLAKKYNFSFSDDDPLDSEDSEEYWSLEEGGKIKKPRQTRWLKILQESVTYLIFAHAVRMTEADTPEELGGPFFQDWFDSVKAFEWQWDDGDKVFTNYVAHPGQGALFGYIYGLNNRRITYLHFGKSGAYWKFKFHQFLFSLVSTINFEIGPLSEASLGNVGVEDAGGHAIIDYVNTPVLGVFGVSVLEDMADHYINKRVEKNHRIWGRVLRIVLCPTRSFTNIFGFRKPWIRPRDPDYSFDGK